MKADITTETKEIIAFEADEYAPPQRFEIQYDTRGFPTEVRYFVGENINEKFPELVALDPELIERVGTLLRERRESTRHVGGYPYERGTSVCVVHGYTSNLKGGETYTCVACYPPKREGEKE